MGAFRRRPFRGVGETREIAVDLTNFALELDKAYLPACYPNAPPSGSPRKRYTMREAESLVGYAGKYYQVQ